MGHGYGWLRAALVALAVVGWLAAGTGAPRLAWAEPGCPADEVQGGWYVVWVPGFLSSSLTGLQPGALDASNHMVRDEAAPVRAALAAGLAPSPRFVYFSYGVARLARQGEAPERAWLDDDPFNGAEPRYWPRDTSSYRLQAQADALDWLVRGLLRCDPEATVDVIGFSLGGVVALSWAATAGGAPGGPLAAVHRVILIDSPVGGVNPAILGAVALAAPPEVAYAFGSAAILPDLLPGSAALRRLPAAVDRVDVASIENSRDFLVNGAPLPPEAGVGPAGWLARGAAVSGLLSGDAADVSYDDLGTGMVRGPSLWEAVIAIHGAVLADVGALGRLLILLTTDGPLWQAQYPEVGR
jgi:hypothetical protein